MRSQGIQHISADSSDITKDHANHSSVMQATNIDTRIVLLLTFISFTTKTSTAVKYDIFNTGIYNNSDKKFLSHSRRSRSKKDL